MRLVPILPFFLLPFCSSFSSAQNWIEEVVVRGEFRATSLRELPSSASVLLPEKSAAVVNHLEDVISRSANVNFSSGSSRARYFQIRGIGERGQFIEPINPSVGLLYDGVDLSGIGTAANIFDVSQVEILRGPQGTVYGANSIAGTINIISSDPTEEFEGSIEAETGDYGAFGVGLVLSGPVNSTSGYRLSVKDFRHDGFVENVYLDRKDTNAKEEQIIRFKYKSKGENSQWHLNLGKVNVNNGYDSFSLDNDRLSRSDQPGLDDQDTTFFSLLVKNNMSEHVDLELSGGLASSDISYGYDEDWTFVGFDPWEYSSTDLYERDVETFSYQARMVSTINPSNKGDELSWVLGAYGYHHDLNLTRRYMYLEADFTSRYKVDRFAIYGEVEKKLSKVWVLSLGLRGEETRLSYRDSSKLIYDPDEFMGGGRIQIERRLNKEQLIYASANRGYKSGGFNTDGSIDEDLRLFSGEALWNFETGYKALFLEDKVQAQVTVFRMQRRDIQVPTSIVRQRADGSSEFVEYTGNAAEGFNQGLELDLVIQATGRLKIDASFGVLDTEFSSYLSANELELVGREQAHAPGYQFFIGAEYMLQTDWLFQIELEGKDEFFFSESHNSKSKSYELINVGITFLRDSWEGRVWIKNLADNNYFVRGYNFGNDPRNFYESQLWTQLGYPRNFGLSVRGRF